MERNNVIQKLKEYNQTLSLLKCTSLERAYIHQINREDFFMGFLIDYSIVDTSVETFLKKQHYFKGLLPQNYDKLCFYLNHIQEYTCHSQIIRMDVRSKNFSHYEKKILLAIGSFYVFYGLQLSLKNLIYGQYRQFPFYVDFSSIITVELLQNNPGVIQYCKDVLTNQNNTAILTRDVIKAIEQSSNEELQNLLTQLFLAAKYQEGLRQAIIETVDEGTLSYFMQILDVVKQHNLLRFSSIQRGVLTWIGIGYDVVEQKQIQWIFDCLYQYIKDEDTCYQALSHQNPLCVYIALYCIGLKNLDEAIKKAIELLDIPHLHIVACALVYLSQTKHFDIIENKYFLEKYCDEVWISALYIHECLEYDFKKLKGDQNTNQYFFTHFIQFVSQMKSQQTYTSQGFEWFSIVLHKRVIIEKIFEMIRNDPTVDKLIAFLPYISTYLDVDDLKTFMHRYFPRIPQAIKKEYIIKNIISHNKYLSQYITDLCMTMSFSPQDILNLESRLKTKKDYVRANIVKIIAHQSDEQILESHQRLLQSPQKQFHQSALELERLVPKLFDHKEKKWKGKEDGYGLYQPYQKYDCPYQSLLTYDSKVFLKKVKIPDLSFINIWNKQQVKDYLKKWDQRIQQHAHDEYQIFGDDYQIGYHELYLLNFKEHSLEALPLSHIWKQYFQEDQLSIHIVFQLILVLYTIHVPLNYILDKKVSLVTISDSDIKELTYFKHIEIIFKYYFYERENNQTQFMAAQLLEFMNQFIIVPYYKKKDIWLQKNVYESVSHHIFFLFLIDCLHLKDTDDQKFCQLFPILYESYIKFNLNLSSNIMDKLTLEPLILARAVTLKLLPMNALLEGILDTHISCHSKDYSIYYNENMLRDAFKDAYYKGHYIYGRPTLTLPKKQQAVYQCLRTALDCITHHFLMIEKDRLNDETVVSPLMNSLKVILGLENLILALHVLDEETMKRPSYDLDRQSIFIKVIMHCYPLETDTYEMLKKEGFSEKRLVETAMIAPQWMDMIQQVLGWNSFKEACYYFIAHMKVYDEKIKKAEIVNYTDLDPQDLRDGAFDIEWCKRIYHTLGERKMTMILQSAKFLCENSFHIRAQKYAEACLGKKSKSFFQQQVIDKRNKDALNAYCICPIDNDQDLLERYLFLQEFIKQSKKFGAQRQASEKRCYEIALMNLARNSRLKTVTRLSWMMESLLVHDYQKYLIPQQIEDIEVCLQIDSQGNNTICVSRNHKMLKSIPTKYRKNVYVEEIQRVHKLWNEQYRRSRNMLEQAMEERIVFSKEEIFNIAKNPIVSPMLEKLVLYSHDCFGFYVKDQLQTLRGLVDFDDQIWIAHPYDLYKNQIWHKFQEYIFKHQIIQPFKQVFRELYIKLEDELHMCESKRYTGYQIQTQKAAGVLKQRKWNVSYGNGLEKVFYHDNLIVQLYAQADWFSPSDIEAPSIDYVAFSSRKDQQPVCIQDIDDILYSEIMRDLDMAVSVAYVGGVDPITSISTIELRKTIIQLTCQLMHLKNVTLKDHFANIQGQFNDYSIHLGSGVIHQKGGPTIEIVPVYSQKRGKVYLPFLDEDPMSAQILTKVIMFAKDNTIKDPSILKQIQTYSFE